MVWSNTLWVKDIFTWRLSTKEEIESMLWEEAEKRGIDKDTKIEECLRHGDAKLINTNNFGVCYDDAKDMLWNVNGCIYHNGKWATPLDPNKEIKETISRLEKELEELKEKVK
jgi:protein-arginine kinase activator protein McsA